MGEISRELKIANAIINNKLDNQNIFPFVFINADDRKIYVDDTIKSAWSADNHTFNLLALLQGRANSERAIEILANLNYYYITNPELFYISSKLDEYSAKNKGLQLLDAIEKGLARYPDTFSTNLLAKMAEVYLAARYGIDMSQVPSYETPRDFFKNNSDKIEQAAKDGELSALICKNIFGALIKKIDNDLGYRMTLADNFVEISKFVPIEREMLKNLMREIKAKFGDEVVSPFKDFYYRRDKLDKAIELDKIRFSIDSQLSLLKDTKKLSMEEAVELTKAQYPDLRDKENARIAKMIEYLRKKARVDFEGGWLVRADIVDKYPLLKEFKNDAKMTFLVVVADEAKHDFNRFVANKSDFFFSTFASDKDTHTLQVINGEQQQRAVFGDMPYENHKLFYIPSRLLNPSKDYSTALMQSGVSMPELGEKLRRLGSKYVSPVLSIVSQAEVLSSVFGGEYSIKNKRIVVGKNNSTYINQGDECANPFMLVGGCYNIVTFGKFKSNISDSPYLLPDSDCVLSCPPENPVFQFQQDPSFGENGGISIHEFELQTQTITQEVALAKKLKAIEERAQRDFMLTKSIIPYWLASRPILDMVVGKNGNAIFPITLQGMNGSTIDARGRSNTLDCEKHGVDAYRVPRLARQGARYTIRKDVAVKWRDDAGSVYTSYLKSMKVPDTSNNMVDTNTYHTPFWRLSEANNRFEISTTQNIDEMRLTEDGKHKKGYAPLGEKAGAVAVIGLTEAQLLGKPKFSPHSKEYLSALSEALTDFIAKSDTPVYLCEGEKTACAINTFLGGNLKFARDENGNFSDETKITPVFYSGDCGNLSGALEQIIIAKTKLGEKDAASLKVIICADNDDNDVGLLAARDAQKLAKSLGIKNIEISMPAAKSTDWADVLVKYGVDASRAIFNNNKSHNGIPPKQESYEYENKRKI